MLRFQGWLAQIRQSSALRSRAGQLVTGFSRSASSSRVRPRPEGEITYIEDPDPASSPVTSQQLWDVSAQHCRECHDRWGLQQALVFGLASHRVLTSAMVITVGPARLQAGRGSAAMGTQAAHLVPTVYANGRLLYETCDPVAFPLLRECAKLSMSATQTLPRVINTVDTLLEISRYSQGKFYQAAQLRTLVVNWDQSPDWLAATLYGNSLDRSTRSKRALERLIKDTKPGPKRLVLESYHETFDKYRVADSVQDPNLGIVLLSLEVGGWPRTPPTTKVVKSVWD